MLSRMLMLLAVLNLPSYAVTVTTGTGLTAALNAASGGDTIYLAPGNYGSPQYANAFDVPVYVTAADTADRPVFNYMRLKIGSRNLHFSYLDFYPYDRTVVDQTYYDLLRLNGTTADVFEHCTFTGKLIDNPSDTTYNGYGSGYGIMGNADSLTIRYCEFTDLAKCMSVDLTNSNIGFNYMHHYRSDGIFIGEATGLVIENNILYAPWPYLLPDGAGDHPDFIQATGLKDVIIRNNLFNQGPGNHSQGIFIGANDRIDAGNVTVENNIVYLGQANALRLNDLPGSAVRNNLVLMSMYNFNLTPVLGIIGNGDGTVVENNIAERFGISPDTGQVTVRNNIDCQREDPDADWYYGDIFVGAMDDSAATFESFFLVPGALDTFTVKPGVDYTKFTQFGLWGQTTGILSYQGPADYLSVRTIPDGLEPKLYTVDGRYVGRMKDAVRLPAGVYLTVISGCKNRMIVVK